jgi:ribosomal-protein-alanine N-acetyltransferase
MTILMTERLTLRPLLPDDAEAYAAMRYHPEVAKWLPPSAVPDPVAAVHGTIERFTAAWDERRYAPWGVFREGRLIGHCGLNYVPDFGETEVLWALHPEAWGKGYATEVARAALAYGFDTLGLALIFAITFPDNLASQAVMKRLGLGYRRRVDYKGLSDIVWFDIDRPEWTRQATIRK